MHIHHQSLTEAHAHTIAWRGNALVDWTAAGETYGLDGQRSQAGQYHYDLAFDRAITSADGRYALIYQNLGTKGLLLRDGELLREINRSFYHAHDYEYPATFATVAGVTYLIHCPVSYCQLDFEDVETGELVTNVPGRKPDDVFHSRLEASPGGRYLLSKGWLWHPWNVVIGFDIAACLANPLLLDQATLLKPAFEAEVCTAGFLSDELVLLGTADETMAEEDDPEATLPPGSIATWNLRTQALTAPVRVPGEFGNLFPLSEKLAWDLCGHPKLLDLATGTVVASLPELATGWQQSAIVRGEVPAIVFDRATGRVAVKLGSTIEVLSVAL